tara:strand:+ start:1186 stop:1707 length:522 start_codon:yes stop_codon:yes gene_type:complete
MDELEEQINLYETIIDLNYKCWIEETELDVDKEDYRLKVDLTYRMRFQKFPIGDEHIESRLDEICDEIGEEIVNQETVKKESVETMKLRERFLKSVEIFLRQKSMAYEQEYPQNRRLKRKDIRIIQRIDFMTDVIDEKNAYVDIFDELIDEGYFRLIEKGGHEKHDIFHVVEV